MADTTFGGHRFGVAACIMSPCDRGKDLYVQEDELAHAQLLISYGQAFVAPQRRQHRSSMSVRLPDAPILKSKGGCAVISDSLSRNTMAKQAGDLSVRGFLSDYYSTPEHWDTKTSATRVLRALNSWCYSQSQHVKEGGFVSSMSALVLLGREGHLFHMGDTLVFRLRGAEFEQLTRDHVTDVGGVPLSFSGIGHGWQPGHRLHPSAAQAGGFFRLHHPGRARHAHAV